MKKNSLLTYKSLNLLLIILLTLFSFISYTLGVANISFSDAVKVILHQLPFFKKIIDISHIPNNFLTILINIRLPRVILSIIVGMGLAVVGGVFQGVFKNHLAEPYILGVSSGASLFATIAIVFLTDNFYFIFSSTSLFAIVGALLTVGIVLLVSSFDKANSSATLLLTGISISLFCNSISTMLISLNPDKIKNITLWSMGSFGSSTWQKVAITVPIILICIIVISFHSRYLNAISIGETEAKSLGVPVSQVKTILVIASSIIVALSVASSGIIGFVGLIIPNLLRIIIGADYRKLSVTSALSGGLLLLFCDTIGRIIVKPGEIPAGSITAFIGAPFFIFIIVNGRGGYKNG